MSFTSTKIIWVATILMQPYLTAEPDQCIRSPQKSEAVTLINPDCKSNRYEMIQFLKQLAHAEPGRPLVKHSMEPFIKNMLNEWQEPVLASDDLELIHLYQRAVRNFNSFVEEKTKPITTYYKHYQAPAFFIPTIQLVFDIKEAQVMVTTHLDVQRNSENSTLILDGKDQNVQSVSINGLPLARHQYQVTYHELIIQEIPQSESFNVEIVSQIDPFNNSSLEGMYVCRDWLTTQCESEGARRIFFTLDRPDVLSRITTTIVANKTQYPYRLSNGNLVEESEEADGRWKIVWDDPFPKPSYLFACVLGDFSLLTSQFTTKSGNAVELQVYVEPGKESRAPYSLYALKKAMEFDELFFDREYDLSCLKMVGIPDFNSGAMENKGLMIFNDTRLLVDSKSGTDSAFREVARVIGHEYFHNWSGNRVTIRNWFEIALKEAFTDWRAIRFGEWIFGEEFIRPKDVATLKESQFPEEYSEKGHPIMVESYVDAHSIYDGTTYVKGREVFRAFELFVNSLIPEGFRETLNIYFSKNDGKAVTFRELLSAADEILNRAGKNSTQFERWFHQSGTPQVNVKMNYSEEKNQVEFIISQACPHPKTGQNQHPFVIPFSIELVGQEGSLVARQNLILDKEEIYLAYEVHERPSPIFMHGYSAPVIVNFDYSFDDLGRIIKFSDDAYCRWDASQNYSKQAIQQIIQQIEAHPEIEKECAQTKLHFQKLLKPLAEALKSSSLSPLAKAQLLTIPSIRALSQAFEEYDFVKLAFYQKFYAVQLGLACQVELKEIIREYAISPSYQPSSDQMQIRELKNTALMLLSKTNEEYHPTLRTQYTQADNFNDSMAAFTNCMHFEGALKEFAITHFYEKWKEDKAVFNYWLSAQASSPNCTIDDLIRLESTEGYDQKNPNHLRSVIRAFTANLGCYHDPKGEGYRYVVNRILEISSYNPMLAHNHLAVGAFQDFEKLPITQKKLMAKELKRLQSDGVSPQTRDLVEKMLQRYAEDNEKR